MPKDPRMSALDKVAGMVKGVGRAMSGSMSDRMEKPDPWKGAKRAARGATRNAKRTIAAQGRTTGLKPTSPPGVVQDAMSKAGKAVGDVGRGSRGPAGAPVGTGRKVKGRVR